MKGIILAGGTGSRLYPLTTVVNKQLLPVYDKPMIYYPLSVLINLGIKEYCLISSPEHIDFYKKLLKDGSHLGLNITYEIQQKPNGIAESFIVAEKFINKDKVALVLGDNIFDGISDLKIDFDGGLIFAYEVNNPQDYAVVELGENGETLSVIEKPKNSKSKLAVPGLYFFDNKVCEYSKKLKPSKRNELEISDLINIYLKEKRLKVIKFPRGSAWLDAGQPDSFFQSAAYVKTIQDRQGVKLGCIEEDCLKKNFINKLQFKKTVNELPNSEYKKYLEKLI